MEDNLTIGKIIKEKIKEKNISIEELQQKSNVPKKYLLIILNDDYENYPAYSYLKGYLKEIAKTLSLDFSEFENILNSLEIKKSNVIQPKYQPIFSIDKTTSGSRFLLIIFIIVLIAIIGIFLFLKRENNKVENIAENKTLPTNIINGTIKTNKNENETFENKIKEITNKENNTIVVKKDNLTFSIKKKENVKKEFEAKQVNSDNKTGVLKIFANELTWIRITIDNVTKKTYFLRKGDNVTLYGKKYFKLDIGNAGGITIQLNNKNLGKPGKKGEVKHIVLKAFRGGNL